MLAAIIVCGGFLFAIGIVYPVVMIAIYPIYRKITGDKDFKKYLRDI